VLLAPGAGLRLTAFPGCRLSVSPQSVVMVVIVMVVIVEEG
jgi:hypothetical protein